MSSSARRFPPPGPRATSVTCDEEYLTVQLDDGRRLSVPLDYYPRLLNATPAQRENWELLGDGFGIHWPDVDEDLSVEGLLRGSPAPDSTRRVS